MRIRTITAFFAVAAIIAALTATSFADDKQLQNVKGDVSYQKSSGQAQPLAKDATIALADNDYTVTGAESLAAVSLPDSSRVLVGSNSKVQLAFFNQAENNSAKFLVFNGRVRFTVEHPQGAHANYTFQTSTGNIAVRGTEGDIQFDTDGTLRVNVYDVSDPGLPVQVTTPDGQTFTLNKGQTLLAQEINGVITAKVQQLTQQLIDQFSPDFGVPANMNDLKQTVLNQVKSKVCPPFIPVC